MTSPHPPAVSWSLRAFDALAPLELYELLALRARVFVVEQRCAYQDLDGQDASALHLLGREAPPDGRDGAPGALVAYARLFPPGPDGAARIGRVVSAPAARGQGLGRAACVEALRELTVRFPAAPVVIGAQAYLLRFYEQLGFEQAGSHYLEDGIPHLPMRRAPGPVSAEELGSGAARRGGPERSLVRLRPVAEEDVDGILGWVNDPEVVGNFATFAGEPFTREQELAWIRQVRASSTERVFTVLAADDGRYLGQTGLHQIHRRSGLGRLAVIVGRRQDMGRGFGSAAIARTLDLAFGDEGLHKVWLVVFQTNQRARRTYERLGFTVEGILREEYRHRDGWHTMLRMGLLADEWRARGSA